MSVLRALTGPIQALSGRSRSPGLGRAKLLCQSGGESERDGFASDLTHAISHRDANTAPVTVRPGLPESGATCRKQMKILATHSPDYGVRPSGSTHAHPSFHRGSPKGRPQIQIDIGDYDRVSRLELCPDEEYL